MNKNQTITELKTIKTLKDYGMSISLCVFFLKKRDTIKHKRTSNFGKYFSCDHQKFGIRTPSE